MKPYASYKTSGVPWLGALPSGWAIDALKREFLIVNGSTPSSGEASYWDGNLVWVTPSDLGRLVGNDLHDSERKLTEEGLANCGARMVSENSLVISTRAPIGHVAIGKVPFSTNQGCRALVPLRHGDVRYMYYLLVLGKEELQTRGQGTTFLELSSSALGDFKVCLPPADEQQAIADYLDAETARIDTLILEKEELIGLLREWRQSIIAEAVTKGLNGNAAMKPSGVPWLGEVPSHWCIEKLKFFVRFSGGGTPSKDNPAYWGGDIPWVSPKDMKRARISETEDYITEEGQLNSPCALIPSMSVLTVVRSGILQHTIPVALNVVPVSINQDMKALLMSERIDSRFLAYEISGCQKELREVWVKQGATVESVEHQRMADSLLALPPLKEQQAIADYLDTETAKIDHLIAHTHDEIALLKELRSATIADAVLGRIDVRTAPQQ